MKDVLSKVRDKSARLLIDAGSRIVMMSDSHRGDGSGSDDFLKNENIAYHALSHYYNSGFTYIELGDGDELWKNRSLKPLARAHGDLFSLLGEFASKGRLHMLYGNHDFDKKKPGWPFTKGTAALAKGGGAAVFSAQPPSEGLILDYDGREMLLVHGHQVDFLNYQCWMLARFLVRYVWRPLQLVGLKDPTSIPESDEKRGLIDARLSGWAKKEKKMLIAGHTHMEVFAHQNEPLYFNDGCCVHPYGLTCLEITSGEISLVRWRTRTRHDGTLFVKRELVDGPRGILRLFEVYATPAGAP